MSRRRGEFEYRTSIFEGAYRAWSHLGGCSIEALRNFTAAELDPLTNPHDPKLDTRIVKCEDICNSMDKDQLEGDEREDDDINEKSSGHDNEKENESKNENESESDKGVEKVSHLESEKENGGGNNIDHDNLNVNGQEVQNDHKEGKDDKKNEKNDEKTSKSDNTDHTHAQQNGPDEIKETNTDSDNEVSVYQHFYPYEPLPRSGLAHPFIQAILSPWLGAEADSDDVRQGLTTLRTWWQHRRKGESVSARAAFNSLKMKFVIEGYTRHFFNLAHSMVVTDNEFPPRSLCGLLYVKDDNKSPQNKQSKQQLTTKHKSSTKEPNQQSSNSSDAVSFPLSDSSVTTAKEELINEAAKLIEEDQIIPIVYICEHQDVQIKEFVIALDVIGMTCIHCIQVIETTLRGIHGIKYPINGIADVIADLDNSVVLIKITDPIMAKHVCHEVEEALRMVGYYVSCKGLNWEDVKPKLGEKFEDVKDGRGILTVLNKGFDSVIPYENKILIYWTKPCKCSKTDMWSSKCPLHSQISQHTLEAIETRGAQAIEVITTGNVTILQPSKDKKKQEDRKEKNISSKTKNKKSTDFAHSDTEKKQNLPEVSPQNKGEQLQNQQQQQEPKKEQETEQEEKLQPQPTPYNENLLQWYSPDFMLDGANMNSYDMYQNRQYPPWFNCPPPHFQQPCQAYSYYRNTQYPPYMQLGSTGYYSHKNVSPKCPAPVGMSDARAQNISPAEERVEYGKNDKNNKNNNKNKSPNNPSLVDQSQNRKKLKHTDWSNTNNTVAKEKK